MRYYSEEDVSEMLAKEFDEACSYSKPYSGVKMSDYHSIEIPQTDWHTGTPTEEGYYLCHIQFIGEDYESDEEGYDIPYWFKNGSWEGDDGNARIIAWRKIEPYKED